MPVRVALPDGTEYQFNPTFRVEALTDDTRLVDVTIDQRHGAVHEPDLVALEARAVTLSGTIYADTRVDAEAVVRDIARVLNAGELKLYRHESEPKYLVCRKQGFKQTYVEGTGGCVVHCQITLRAVSPWFVAASPSADIQTPAASPHNYQVTSTGTARVPPVITITAGTAALTNPKLSNLSTDQVVEWTGTVPAGQALVIDCDRREARLNGTAASGGLNDAFFVDGFELQPGVNGLRYEGTVGGGMSVRLDWRDRWY